MIFTHWSKRCVTRCLIGQDYSFQELVFYKLSIHLEWTQPSCSLIKLSHDNSLLLFPFLCDCVCCHWTNLVKRELEKKGFKIVNQCLQIIFHCDFARNLSSFFFSNFLSTAIRYLHRLESNVSLPTPNLLVQQYKRVWENSFYAIGIYTYLFNAIKKYIIPSMPLFLFFYLRFVPLPLDYMQNLSCCHLPRGCASLLAQRRWGLSSRWCLFAARRGSASSRSVVGA